MKMPWIKSKRAPDDKSQTRTIQLGAVREFVFLDEKHQIIYVDEERRSNSEMQRFLDRAARHDIWPVKFEPLRDIKLRLVAHEKSKPTKNHDAEINAQDFARRVIRDAVAERATDIHILRKQQFVEIQFRVKRSLMVYADIDVRRGDLLINALYRLGTTQEPTIKLSKAQDGAINGPVLDGLGLENIRMVRGPAYPVSEGGGHMELRLQYNEERPKIVSSSNTKLRIPEVPKGELKFAEYGFSAYQIGLLKYLSMQSCGVIIFTGPTGSGKTTSIAELARHKARCNPHKRLVTIEQPVEYPLPWAIQLEVANIRDAAEAGSQFAEHFREALRMDPDDLIVGEIRDAQVALTCISAAQTGHGVLTTMHVQDPFDWPLRLQGMDHRRLNFSTTCNSSVVRGVVAQRLIRTLCPHCKMVWRGADDHITELSEKSLRSWVRSESAPLYRRNPNGCTECQNTGVGGVTSVAEVVETHEMLMADFCTIGPAAARRRHRARSNADTTMIEKAIQKVISGLIDPRDAIEAVEQFPSKDLIMMERELGRKELKELGF